MSVNSTPTSPRPHSALVCDFDGTLTRHDFYTLVQARWWRKDEHNPWDDYLAGRLTHFDALNQIYARVRGDESAIHTFLDGMQLDPTVSNAFQQLHQAGWAIIIASAGCEWYIRYHLAKANIQTPLILYSNPGRYSPSSGLLMSLPTQSKFFNPQTGVDKVAIVRDALARFRRVAYAGDGPPDLPASELAHTRFARAWLAEALTAKKLAFEPLVDLATAARNLLQS